MREEAPAPGVRAEIPLRLAWEALERRALERAAAERIEAGRGLLRASVRVTGLRLGARDGRVEARVRLRVRSGPFGLDLAAALRGTPVVEGPTTVALLEPDLALEEGPGALRSLLALAREPLRDALARAARIELGERLGPLLTEASRALDGRELAPGVRASGAVDDVALLEVRAADDALEAVVALRGRLSLELTELPPGPRPGAPPLPPPAPARRGA